MFLLSAGKGWSSRLLLICRSPLATTWRMIAVNVWHCMTTRRMNRWRRYYYSYIYYYYYILYIVFIVCLASLSLHTPLINAIYVGSKVKDGETGKNRQVREKTGTNIYGISSTVRGSDFQCWTSGGISFPLVMFLFFGLYFNKIAEEERKERERGRHAAKGWKLGLGDVP